MSLLHSAFRLFLAAAILVAAPHMRAWGEEELGSYAIDSNAISVSGISSGGYMAQQHHVAHAKQIMNVGIVAAGPWDCATAVQVCSHSAGSGLPFLGPPNLASSITTTKDAAKAGQIDPTKFLANAKVFLVSGTQESVEPQSVMDELNQYYLTFVPPAKIRYVNNIPAEHAMVADGYGNPCGHLGTPYINNCGYDTAGEMLKFIYGSLNPPGDPATGKLTEFAQTDFLPPDAISMAPVGHMFVPADCQSTPGCRLHVAFHGCLQSQDLIGDAFYAHAGCNRWAATNRVLLQSLYSIRTRNV